MDLSAIAAAAEVSEERVYDFFVEKHALAMPDSIVATDIAAAIKDARGKNIFNDGQDSLKNEFSITRDEVLNNMEEDRICDDIKYFCQSLITFATP
ncbi:hypothetical protein [Rosenbergiella epipactidis]|uniref:hypothetical protein n=1 Tax=Rosenbergiella epipactidis TaxID=1544694 RepID=UPI001F4ED9DC|nr:hypothetical protein [Rosenbergiella epipactidis]